MTTEANTVQDLLSGAARWRLEQGDCLRLLRELPPDSFDLVVADPPYSSGGMTRGDRMQSTDSKYTQTEQQGARPDFAGDNRDQRGWAYWMALWLLEALRVTRPSGYLLCFTDWRQLPTATDCLQAGGWVYRGIVAWDKTESAKPPHTGYFRHQCEYLVWGTRGVSRPAKHGGPWPGCFRIPVRHHTDKHHQTGKPTPLLQELVQVAPPGGLVLDPFAGSGTTGAACLREGRRFLGCELDAHYAQLARQRLDHEARGIPYDANTRQKLLFP